MTVLAALKAEVWFRQVCCHSKVCVLSNHGKTQVHFGLTKACSCSVFTIIYNFNILTRHQACSPSALSRLNVVFSMPVACSLQRHACELTLLICGGPSLPCVFQRGSRIDFQLLQHCCWGSFTSSIEFKHSLSHSSVDRKQWCMAPFCWMCPCSGMVAVVTILHFPLLGDAWGQARLLLWLHFGGTTNLGLLGTDYDLTLRH